MLEAQQLIFITSLHVISSFIIMIHDNLNISIREILKAFLRMVKETRGRVRQCLVGGFIVNFDIETCSVKWRPLRR